MPSTRADVELSSRAVLTGSYQVHGSPVMASMVGSTKCVWGMINLQICTTKTISYESVHYFSSADDRDSSCDLISHFYACYGEEIQGGYPKGTQDMVPRLI